MKENTRDKHRAGDPGDRRSQEHDGAMPIVPRRCVDNVDNDRAAYPYEDANADANSSM